MQLKKIIRNRSLSIVLFTLFALFLFGQSFAGHLEFNEEQREHKGKELTYSQYLKSSHFGEAIMENWESEFLQMGLYVILTVFLYQKGSAESKNPDGKNSVDEAPLKHKSKTSPWPVRRGGLALAIYKYSLSLSLLLLFLFSFLLHAHFGAQEYNGEQLLHGGNAQYTLWTYLRTSKFWFESFQNWQSEFFSIGAVVVLSIYLRQQGSPESKPVAMGHSEMESD